MELRSSFHRVLQRGHNKMAGCHQDKQDLRLPDDYLSDWSPMSDVCKVSMAQCVNNAQIDPAIVLMRWSLLFNTACYKTFNIAALLVV